MWHKFGLKEVASFYTTKIVILIFVFLFNNIYVVTKLDVYVVIISWSTDVITVCSVFVLLIYFRNPLFPGHIKQNTHHVMRSHKL